MSGNLDNQEKYKFLRELSAAQLEELLRQHADEDCNDSDMDFVACILEIREAQEKECPVNHLSNVEQAWKDFQETYNASESEAYSLYEDCPSLEQAAVLPPQHTTGKTVIFRKIALVAVIGCIIALLMSTALGYNIFQMVGQWTKDAFSFVQTDSTSDIVAAPAAPQEPRSYDSLQEALDDLGITEIQAPSWLPTNFVPIQVTVVSYTTSKEIKAYYANEDLTISMSFNLFEKAQDYQYEKDESPVQEYSVNGVKHYIFTNNERAVAAWTINSLQCSVRGDISVEELELIIDSMY